MLIASQVSAQVRAPGGVTIYDERNCAAAGNAAKVTVPFSIGVTGLRPFSEVQIFVTDKDAKPEVTYGPGLIKADQNGNVCLNLLSAPVGSWKVDVVEQGSGFTDSKVFTVEGLTLPTVPTSQPPPPPPPTIAPSTSAPAGSTTTTAAGSTTTSVGSSTTSTLATTAPTTSVPVATSGPSVPGLSVPFAVLPWVFEQTPVEPGTPVPIATAVAGTGSLPASGASMTARVGGLALALLGVGGVVVLGTRRRAREGC
jgi:hypothetical protein